MSSQTHDPVHRARYSFQPDGENLIVDTWLEPGGALPPHLHPHQEERWSVVEGPGALPAREREAPLSAPRTGR